ncbi:Phosphoglucomutase [Giardia muris]|uniref:Phosphoglucomutase n=1 Tax=Giardia muris TaxID=5742 RepID=A0A4Z1SQB0_GIAMU|nr:Phosphoglucomutase [Giardia muris]|eukprot:TNJ27085.1 Phosphoglucomutase [Giardia muris]
MTEAKIRAEKLAGEWQALDRWSETRDAVERRLAAGDYEALARDLDPANRVGFGTAGLRAEFGPGYTRLNNLVITQTAQAMYFYCLRIFGEEELRSRGVGLGYDARYHSKDFAEITAATFLVRGVRVYLFEDFAPTPYASYLNKFYSCACGVMVTASHNPSKDNGYKVYGVGNGIQIISPHDTGIIELLKAGDDHVIRPWPETVDIEACLSQNRGGLLTMITEESQVMQSYRQEGRIMKFFYRKYGQETPVSFRIGYSAMWGVGYKPLLHTLEGLFDFSRDAIANRFFFFEDECRPDPAFGGESKPNPEERHNMVRLCTRAEEQTKSQPDLPPIKFVIATDPDADRIAVAELINPTAATLDRRWFIYHGNHIGLILADWCLTNFRFNPVTKALLKERYGSEHPPLYISNSTVSSKALVRIAEAYDQVTYEECLTGFKWIGTLSEAARARGVVPCYSYEESIGYTIGGVVTDKDGVATAGVLSELIIDLYEHQTDYGRENRRLYDYMSDIGEKYGYYVWTNGNIVVNTLDDVKHLFSKLVEDSRATGAFVAGNGTGNRYITQVGRFRVLQARDVQAPGWDTRPEAKDHVPNLPVSSSPMITLWCEDGVVCTLRPSGTEPKVKYYIESCSTSFEASEELGREFAEAFLQLVK